MNARDLRLGILQGRDDDAVLHRAYALGWRPPSASLDELARLAARDTEALLRSLSEHPLPFDTTRETQE